VRHPRLQNDNAWEDVAKNIGFLKRLVEDWSYRLALQLYRNAILEDDPATYEEPKIISIRNLLKNINKRIEGYNWGLKAN
jgi:hypothetical protein